MTDHTSLHSALAAAQADLPHIGKDSRADTGKFSYAYAGLPVVNAALLPHLASHGLSWTVCPDAEQGIAVGTLTHGTTDQSVSASWPLPKTSDPQQLGSALTYARRYLLLSIVGAAPDDDDDGAAAKQASRRPAAKPRDDGNAQQREDEYRSVLADMPADFVETIDYDAREKTAKWVRQSDSHLVKALEKLDAARAAWADDF